MTAGSGKVRADRHHVEQIALDEMVALAGGSAPVRRAAMRALLQLPAAALARSLVALDREMGRATLRRAALSILRRYDVSARVEGPGLRLSPLDQAIGPLPARGPLLVIANHPGLFDALALFAASGRDDLAVLAADRPLLRALPNVQRRLLLVGADGGDDLRSAAALRAAVRHLDAGGALLHFPAGRIEPDPRLAPPGDDVLLPWRPGLGLLVRVALRRRPDLRVVPVLVSGVTSRRARALAARLGRRQGLTDAVIPLLQLTFPGFGDVDVRVTVGDLVGAAALADDAEARLRAALEAIARRVRATAAIP